MKTAAASVVPRETSEWRFRAASKPALSIARFWSAARLSVISTGMPWVWWRSNAWSPGITSEPAAFVLRKASLSSLRPFSTFRRNCSSSSRTTVWIRGTLSTSSG